MFTRCPQCETVFEIDLRDLDRAGGRVRCGECQHVFDARGSLSETADFDAGDEIADDPAFTETGIGWVVLPGNEGDDDSAEPARYVTAADSGAWNSVGAEPDSAASNAGDASPEEVMRFDDDTPLDIFLGESDDEPFTVTQVHDPSPVTFKLVGDDDADSGPPRAAGDTGNTDDIGHVDDIADNFETDDWAALLAEIDTDAPPREPTTDAGLAEPPGRDDALAAVDDMAALLGDDAAPGPLEIGALEDIAGLLDETPAGAAKDRPSDRIHGDEPAAIDLADAVDIADAADDGDAARPGDRTGSMPDESRSAPAAARNAGTGDDATKDFIDSGFDADDSFIEDVVSEFSEAEVDMPAADLADDDDAPPAPEESGIFVTESELPEDIDLSGEYEVPDDDGDVVELDDSGMLVVESELPDDDEAAASAGDSGIIVIEGAPAERAADTGKRSDDDEVFESAIGLTRPDSGQPAARRGLWGALAALMLVAGSAQVAHDRRAELATLPALNPLYAAVYGDRLEPNWDITNICYEKRASFAADGVMVVYARLANRGETPLPYPQLHVTLSGRYDDGTGDQAIAHRVLEPSEYLRDSPASERIGAGARFEAFARLVDPGPDVTGYDIEACFRRGSSTLHCNGGCP